MQDDTRSAGPKGKVKRIRQQAPEGPYGGATPTGLSMQMQQASDLQQAAAVAADDDDFMARLEMVKAEGKERARTLPAKPAAPGAGGAASSGGGAVFDAPSAPETDIYANPPSLADTFLGQLNSEISDPALRCAGARQHGSRSCCGGRRRRCRRQQRAAAMPRRGRRPAAHAVHGGAHPPTRPATCGAAGPPRSGLGSWASQRAPWCLQPRSWSCRGPTSPPPSDSREWCPRPRRRTS